MCDSSFWNCTRVIVYIPPCPIIPLLEPLRHLWMDPRSSNFYNPSLMTICNGFDNEQPSRYNKYQSEALCVHLQEYPFFSTFEIKCEENTQHCVELVIFKIMDKSEKKYCSTKRVKVVFLTTKFKFFHSIIWSTSILIYIV